MGWKGLMRKNCEVDFQVLFFRTLINFAQLLTVRCESICQIFLFVPSATLEVAAAKSLQLCPTLRPHRRRPTRLPRPWDAPGKKNTAAGCHFLLQCMHACCRFCWVWLCATPQTAAQQAPLSTEFSRQEYWSGLPFPSPVDCTNKGKYF